MEDWAQISEWRKATRAERLVLGFPTLAGKIIGFYWPYRGGFDARFVIRHFATVARARHCRRWCSAGDHSSFESGGRGFPMEPKVYGIPVPVGTEVVIPDAAIVPMNGFDRALRLSWTSAGTLRGSRAYPGADRVISGQEQPREPE